MSKYRKKPVVIEAIQYTGANKDEISRFAQTSVHWEPWEQTGRVKTLEGDMNLSMGDYLIKGIKGEFYPCKPDIFEATYEKVEEGEPEEC